jgi:hypothetical protein
MISGMTVAPSQRTYRDSRITAARRRAPPADPVALRLTALPTHFGETRSRTATAPGRTGPPVRHDNRGAIRPIQPDGTRLMPMILGLRSRVQEVQDHYGLLE